MVALLYSDTFKGVIFESVNVKSVKMKKIAQKCQQNDLKKSFPRRPENDTFESVILENVKI